MVEPLRHFLPFLPTHHHKKYLMHKQARNIETPDSRFQFKALAAAAALCLSQGAGAVEIAPYFESWGADTLTGARQSAGLDSATLAFGITRGTCVLHASLLEKLPDARNFVTSGGRLIVSMGGADGVYAEAACTDDQLFALMEKLMADAGTRRIDWDVEGAQLLDVAATERRTRVLVRLQAKYPDMYTSFTLSGWLRGVSEESMNLLRSTAAAGVKIDIVNVMTMTFGVENMRTMVVPSTLAQASIMTFRSVVNQLATIYPAKTPAQLHAMMGITPMIGVNDDGTVFTLADARTIADFVKLNGIGLLSYWSFQRDRAQASNGMVPITTYSGVAQSNQQFLSIFKTASTGTPPPAPIPPPPAPAPAPTPVSPIAQACPSTAWVMYKQYAAGSIVTFQGNQYVAKHANPGYNPTISTYFWSRYYCVGPTPAPAPPATAPAPAPAPAPATSAGPVGTKVCGFPRFTAGQIYEAGSVVAYENHRYIANMWNRGSNPKGTAYWSDWSVYNDPTWVAGRSYAVASIVTYSDGRLFIARASNPGSNPTTNPAQWSSYYGC